jgi:bifunctional non-homologous end joining protein LigD
MVFDVLYLDGWDLTGVTLEDRKATLHALLQGKPAAATIRFCDHQIGQGAEFFAAACQYGLEGIVSKRCAALYRPGRGSDWVKVKAGKREDLVVVAFTDPAGARSGLGALLVAYHTPRGDLVYAGRVGTGFPEKVLAALRRRLGAIERKRPPVTLPDGLSPRGIHWVEPELVAEIAFAAWTRDGILRAATFEGLRDDKSPKEVVLDPTAEPPDPVPPPLASAEVARDGSAMVGGVRITHAERVVYPERGISKVGVAQYYAEIAEFILPHIVRRPLSLLRCPEGVMGERFFQKHMAVGPSNAIKQVPITGKDGTESYLMIEDAKGLLALVQMGVLEIIPGARQWVTSRSPTGSSSISIPMKISAGTA